MRQLCIAVSIFFLLCSWSIGQQKPSVEKKLQYVKIPPENEAVLIASQPECPIRIEEASFYIKANKPGTLFKYKVRNVSTKPISVFLVEAWNSLGTGKTIGNPLLDTDAVLLPGQTLESNKEGQDYEVVPMNARVREELRPENGKTGMKAFWVLVVSQVIFEDGTVYEDKKTSEALEAYLRTLTN